jgi:pyrroloquinoline quinone (PQQ) biosynthesis protein C
MAIELAARPNVLPTSKAPRLRHCTIIGRSDRDGLTLVVGREYFELTKVQGSTEQFLALKRYLDGYHELAEISELTGMSIASVESVVAEMDRLGLFRQEQAMREIPRDQFLRRLDDTCEMWGRQIGYHRLYGELQTGSAPRDVFVGLLIETYHFVKSAPQHISVAVANANNPRWARLLSEYFVEEYDHGGLILETLARIGVPTDRVAASQPIIGTLSLINMLSEIARRSTLGYLACTALFEARRDDYEAGKSDFEAIGRAYGCSADDLAPVVSHVSADLDAGHTGLLADALEDVEAIDAASAHEAVNYLHDLKHSFDQYHDQVLSYYSDISNYVPRPQVDYFAL